jgi:hypothetical protein
VLPQRVLARERAAIRGGDGGRHVRAPARRPRVSSGDRLYRPAREAGYCARRGRWPGNVRELLAEVRQAADLAADEGGVAWCSRAT